MLKIMRTVMNTALNRRLNIITLLRSLPVVSMTSRIHILSNKRSIHSSRTHTSLRRIIRSNLGYLFNAHVSVQHNLIRGRGTQVNRRRTNRYGRLALADKGHKATLLRRHIMSIQRVRGRLIHVRHLHNHFSLDVNHVRLTMASILTRVTKRGRHVLRRSTRLPARQFRYSEARVVAVGYSQAFYGIMGAQRRVSGHNFTNANQAGRHGNTT